MMKKVNIKESEIKIWVGGVCCVFKVVFKKENIMIKWVKFVIIKINDGVKIKSVSRVMILRVVISCLGLLGVFKERLMLGKALLVFIKGYIKG